MNTKDWLKMIERGRLIFDIEQFKRMILKTYLGY